MKNDNPINIDELQTSLKKSTDDHISNDGLKAQFPGQMLETAEMNEHLFELYLQDHIENQIRRMMIYKDEIPDPHEL